MGINKEDYYNENFIFDVYLLVTKNSEFYLLVTNDLHALQRMHAAKSLQAHLQGEKRFVS